MIKIVQAAAFKQTCLALMDEVDAKGTSIIITKRGKAIARLVPVATTRPQALGCLAGKIELVDEDFSLPAWTVRATKGKP